MAAAASPRTLPLVAKALLVREGRRKKYLLNVNARNPLLRVSDTTDPEFKSVHAFDTFANWLLPGRIMVGRYPFLEPSRCHEREEGEAQLMKLLKAGIVTFVCLQEELPPQNEMRVCGERGFLPYKATVELMAATLSGPPSAEVVEGLRNPSLNRFLPPQRKESSPSSKAIKVNFVHFPIVDLGVPSAVKLEELLDDMVERIMSDENIYMHCWGGRGRAGTAGSLLLARLYNLTAKQALERTSLAFQTRGDGGNRSPETSEQVEFVKKFVQTHK